MKVQYTHALRKFTWLSHSCRSSGFWNLPQARSYAADANEHSREDDDRDSLKRRRRTEWKRRQHVGPSLMFNHIGFNLL